MEDFDHRRCVDAWIERVADHMGGAPMIDAFESATASLWQRAHLTLGEVTLAAIVKRVLCSAEDRFPFLSALKLDETKINCEPLRVTAASLRRDQLVDGIRFVLVELLTVIGNLTADILTPALHGELCNASLERAQPAPPRGGRVPHE
jgi:hypothetical protein